MLINGRGERFMSRYHRLADLASRDIVARSIDSEMKNSGEPCVYLDLSHVARQKVEQRFPHLLKTCAHFGIDLAGEPVPVVPAAHYMCGGVIADAAGQTSLPGLFVIGEAACTGVHGANRLASNSLLEAVFFAEATAAAVIAEPQRYSVDPAIGPASLSEPLARARQPEVMILEHDWDEVRRIMWDYVGIVRDRERLDIALSRLRNIRRTVEQVYREALITPELIELRNIALLGELIVLCARHRHESRGLHYTLDHPGKAAGPARDTEIARGMVLDGEGAWESDTASPLE